MRQTSSTYRRIVRWLPPAGRIPKRRNVSEYDSEAATAARASSSEYLGIRRTLVRRSDGNCIGERGFEPRPPGPKPGVQRRLHHSPALVGQRSRRPGSPIAVRPLRVVLGGPNLV